MAGCCSLELVMGMTEQFSAPGQSLTPCVSHIASEKMLGMGCKRPLGYSYCSQVLLYPGAIIPAGSMEAQTWGLCREVMCLALWNFLLPPSAMVMKPTW